jgi:hypothetical protein
MLGPEEPQAEASDYDAFAHQPPFKPRRNRTKMWTILAVLFAVLALGATLAISYFGVPQVGNSFPITRAGATPLKISGKGERRAMASGNELFTVSGVISNPTDAPQRVPQIKAELRDEQGRTVYSWPISAPTPELGPGQTVTFNAAEVDVPRGARKIHLGFGALT